MPLALNRSITVTRIVNSLIRSYVLSLCRDRRYPCPPSPRPAASTCAKSESCPHARRGTSGNRRYACGASSRSPPRKTTPFSAIHFIISSCLTSPSMRIRLPPTFTNRPFAAVRDMIRPAPCTVEKSASREAGESTPSTMTASSPMLPPMKPFCPGNAGVAPLRTTQYRSPPCSSCHAKL